MKNAELLLNIGKNMYNKAKNFIFYAPCGFTLMMIVALFCGEYASRYMLLCGPYLGVNLLFLGLYIIIGIGLCAVFPYYMGLILIGIGQIAANTSTDKSDNITDASGVSVTTGSTDDPGIDKITSTSVTSNDFEIRKDIWICRNCQTENSISCTVRN